MTTSIIELENHIFSLLRNYKTVTREYVIKTLGCKPNNLNTIIKKYKKTKDNPTGLIKVSKDKNSDHPSRHIYSLEVSSFETLHESNKSHLESMLKMIDLYLKNLKELKKQKPLFENVIKTEHGVIVPSAHISHVLHGI